MVENPPISPSPARLGLSVPHSSSTQKIAERNAPIFTLPPHRRAQLLLHEMAGLTTRLFEVSSNHAAWLTAYRGSIPTFLQGSCIPPEAASATTMKEILSIMSSHQSLLGEAMIDMQEIQKIEQDKQMVVPEIASKDSAMRAFAKNLRDTQQVLEQTLEDYEDYRKGKHPKTSNSTSDDTVGIGHLDLSQILTYAHKISYTTFAPPEFGAGQAVLRGAIPPAPQDEQMRASQLYQYADLDVGIPKQTITEPLPVAIMEPTPEKVVVNPMPEVVPGTLPPMPPGWRPGMPIELPTIPLGWKPGDPVPLPPAMEVPAGWKPGDVVLLPKLEEMAPVLPMPVAPARPAEPIQVRYVQLDINPEMQDDDSSEYSTEEGSSEEEDD